MKYKLMVRVSVAQWKQQFLQFSNISERQICTFTQSSKEMVGWVLLDNAIERSADIQFTGPAGIVISTYSMIGITGKRAHDAEKVMQWIRSREWGFLLLDEVHVVPANTFRKCVNGFRVHAKLGLTGKSKASRGIGTS
jgi:DNA excision repair protein ERCC-3